MDNKSNTKFQVGDKVKVTYTDGIGHSSETTGELHRGPLGDNAPYWYVKLGGVAVLFPEKDLEHAEG